MTTVLDILDYGNLDRIWIERTEQTVREGRRKVQKSMFDMHIIRSADNGTTYEDTIDHLSESEREVTGLVFALAGYLGYRVFDPRPFPSLMKVLERERVTVGEPRLLPFACPPA